MSSQADHARDPITAHASTQFTALNQAMTAAEALAAIRQHGVAEKIIYFYVLDDEQRLVGVLPTRRLLMAALDKRIGDLMVSRIVAIPHTATVLDACELFVLHKFLAFPVVDEQRRLVGVVDVSLFTEEVFDISEHERLDDVFQVIGVRLAQIQNASPLKAFRFRFPWLLATIGSGTVCAVLAGAFEATLAQSLVIAFFLTMVLGLGESVTVQSMTVTIQGLHGSRPTWKWYFKAVAKEAGAAVLLGLACGVVVALVVLMWRGTPLPALVIGLSIALALFVACLVGLSVPAALHSLKLDPKIAAGPIALAITDVFTLLFYFGLATVLL